MNFYMKVSVAGSAGFVGSAVSISLFERGDKVVGIDNHNDYFASLIKKRV
jgi:nucleoside-diphosphate-sugar epimerase